MSSTKSNTMVPKPSNDSKWLGTNNALDSLIWQITNARPQASSEDWWLHSPKRHTRCGMNRTWIRQRLEQGVRWWEINYHFPRPTSHVNNIHCSNNELRINGIFNSCFMQIINCKTTYKNTSSPCYVTLNALSCLKLRTSLFSCYYSSIHLIILLFWSLSNCQDIWSCFNLFTMRS